MKILIPTDFSDSARVAVDYAVNMFQGVNDLEFVLLNSFEMPHGSSAGGVMMNLEEFMQRESEKDLAAELKVIREKYPNLKITPVARYGSLENAISRTNIEHKVNMVVMGTHGATGFKKALVGSNAQKVIENVHEPVIAVPLKWNIRPIKKIVYATDLRRIEDPESLKPVCDVSGLFGSKIHVLYVAKSSEDKELIKDEENLPLNKIFNNREREFHVIESSELPDAIAKFIVDIDADMVVVLPKQASFWQKLVKQSVTEQLVFQSKVPILAIKDRKRSE